MSIQGPLSAQLSLYARYSLWATKRLLGAASLLQDYLQKDIALPFKSVRGTLNHMQVVSYA